MTFKCKIDNYRYTELEAPKDFMRMCAIWGQPFNSKEVPAAPAKYPAIAVFVGNINSLPCFTYIYNYEKN